MNNVPIELFQKINGYFLDLCFQEHVKKFRNSLSKINDMDVDYMGVYMKWKIQKLDGEYKFMCYDAYLQVYTLKMDSDETMSV